MRIIGLSGWSGAGKTTLLSKLIPHLTAQGFRVSVIKHAHHDFDLDKPGKDSWVHREAGASEVLIASSRRWALMHELRGASEPPLADLIQKLSATDFVIVEGFKSETIRKIEIHRRDNGKPYRFPDDPNIVAVASDSRADTRLPLVHLDDVAAIAQLVTRHAETWDEWMARTGAR